MLASSSCCNTPSGRPFPSNFRRSPVDTRGYRRAAWRTSMARGRACGSRSKLCSLPVRMSTGNSTFSRCQSSSTLDRVRSPRGKGTIKRGSSKGAAYRPRAIQPRASSARPQRQPTHGPSMAYEARNSLQLKLDDANRRLEAVLYRLEQTSAGLPDARRHARTARAPSSPRAGAPRPVSPRTNPLLNRAQTPILPTAVRPRLGSPHAAGVRPSSPRYGMHAPAPAAMTEPVRLPPGVAAGDLRKAQQLLRDRVEAVEWRSSDGSSNSSPTA